MNRKIYIGACIVLIPILILAGCQTAKKPAPENREAPASDVTTLLDLAEKDPYQDGCVSCHKKTADVDRSLPAYVKRIEGHPEVREATVNACYNCHEAQKSYDLYRKFYQGMHRAHWESEAFYGKAKGQCYSCHTVEKNGVSGIKNYPLAGYRSGLTAQAANLPPVKKEPAKEKKEETDKTKEEKPEGETRDGQATDRDELPSPTP